MKIEDKRSVGMALLAVDLKIGQCFGVQAYKQKLIKKGVK